MTRAIRNPLSRGAGSRVAHQEGFQSVEHLKRYILGKDRTRCDDEGETGACKLAHEVISGNRLALRETT